MHILKNCEDKMTFVLRKTVEKRKKGFIKKQMMCGVDQVMKSVL